MFLQFASILMMSTVKYMLGIGLAIAYNLNFVSSMLLTVGGGMIGVLLFSFFSQLIIKSWNWLRRRKDAPAVFSKRSRFIVKLKNNFGLAGVAFLTPVFLTIPLGTIISNMIEPNKTRVFIYMFAAFLFWSAIFCGVYELFDINLSGTLSQG